MDYPQLVVFDLDFTLWNCGDRWIDCTAWPFRNLDGKVTDAQGSEFQLYPDIPAILDDLDAQGCTLALASRTSQPSWARWLLDEWDLSKRFPHQEIYPGSKVEHFQQLKEETKIPFEKMVFFDDEDRNVIEVQALGVTAQLVPSGVSQETLLSGLDTWRTRQNP